ncbi:MAG: DUF2927 domain-containing protein [Alphaproteobacteria bacterium]
MVDLTLSQAKRTARRGHLWQMPVAVVAVFAALAVWYFWTWSLSAGEAGWIAALFVVPPLLVGGLFAGLIRLAVAGLGHDELRDLRTVLYGVRRARWPAFARLFNAMLDVLFGPRLISIRGTVAGVAIAALAFVVGVTIWVLVVPGEALALLVEHGPASRTGTDIRARTAWWIATLFLAAVPAMLAAIVGVRVAARLLGGWIGLPLVPALGVALPLALLVLLLGAAAALWDGEIAPPSWILGVGLLEFLHPHSWTLRSPVAAALYSVFLPGALLLALAFGIGTVRVLAQGAGPVTFATRRHPLRAALLVVLGICFLANAAIVFARAEAAREHRHDDRRLSPAALAEPSSLLAQAAQLIFVGGAPTFHRLPPGPVQVKIVGDDWVHRRYRESLAANLADFSRLTGRRFTLEPDARTAQTLTIAFAPLRQINSWGWRRGPGLAAGLRRPGTVRCAALPRLGRIVIGSDLPPAIIRRCIAHELAHYVGLLGHGCFARPSVLCWLDDVETLTESDSRIIAALYSPTLEAGMTRDRTMWILHRMPDMTAEPGVR